jgi:hypothetical protein
MDDQTSMRLPIRLLPRRGKQVFQILFFTFFFGFSLFWIAMASTAVRTGQEIEGEPFAAFPYLFPLFGIPFAVIGLLGLGSAIMKLLPGSPYYYIEIGADGIITRRAWKIRRFAWPELSPFGVSLKVTRNKNGTSKTWWVVALRAADAERLAFEAERYNRSIVQIDAGQYGAGDGDMAATVLADWLSGLRADALERPDGLQIPVAVPPDFRDRAIEVLRTVKASSTVAIAAAARRSSVIDRNG